MNTLMLFMELGLVSMDVQANNQQLKPHMMEEKRTYLVISITLVQLDKLLDAYTMENISLYLMNKILFGGLLKA